MNVDYKITAMLYKCIMSMIGTKRKLENITYQKPCDLPLGIILNGINKININLIQREETIAE